MEDTTEWGAAKIAAVVGAFIGGIWIAARKFVKAQEAVPLDRSELLERENELLKKRVKGLEDKMEQALLNIDGQMTGLRQKFTQEIQRVDHKIDRKEALSKEQFEELSEQFSAAMRVMEGAKKLLSDALGK
jgi:hypothetical protein